LQHIIEEFENKPVSELCEPFLRQIGISEDLVFQQHVSGRDVAHGYSDNGETIEGTRKMFPSFAAGALGTPTAMTKFLEVLSKAYNNVEGCGPISHDTACLMLRATDKGCFDFMGVKMGLGIFVGEAGDNRFAIHQGANDGFRAIFCYCFAGPQSGYGFSIFANGDNKAMFLIAQASCEILKHMAIDGIDSSKFQSQVSLDGISQEEIVNIGYKELVFSAFSPTLPPKIVDQNPEDPLSEFNLAIEATVTKVSNQRFARAENVFSATIPKFDPELFCAMGKVMDSWESARHNEQEFDILEAGLKMPAKIQYVLISTKYHLGNQVEFVELYFKTVEKNEWILALPKLKLDGHSEIRVSLEENIKNLDVSDVRIHAFPDGGLTRVGLFGSNLPHELRPSFLPAEQAQCIRYTEEIPHTKKPLQLLYTPSEEEVEENVKQLINGQEFDALSLAYGGKLVSVTNEHYGPAAQVLSPYMPLSMHDGFESARSRVPGHKEILILKLCTPQVVHRIELDFTYFVNNNPRSVEIYGRLSDSSSWITIVMETNVKPFAANKKAFSVLCQEKLSEIKLVAIPDGGVNRVKAFAFHSGHGIKRKRIN